MDIQEIQNRAIQLQLQYRKHNKNEGYADWNVAEYMQGFVGDVGDLAKLIMAKNSYRHIDDAETKIAHELADCLWSVCVLAQELDVDLEKAFMNTMDELETRLKKHD